MILKMEFNPSNNIVQLCLQGMAMEEQEKPVELKTWREKLANLKGAIIN